MQKLILNTDTKEHKDKFFELIQTTDVFFTPPLSDRVDLKSYCNKLLNEGVVLVYTNEANKYIAGCAFYCTPKKYDFAFLSYIASMEKGLGNKLMSEMIRYCKDMGMAGVETQTWSTNSKSISLFKRHGFEVYDRVSNRNTSEESLQLRCIFND